MNRRQVLEAATKVTQGREGEYGKPSASLNAMAELMAAYLGTPVHAHDVAILEIIQKCVRLKHSKGRHVDSWVDIAGYAAIACEVVHEKEDADARIAQVKERLGESLGLTAIQAPRGDRPTVEAPEVAA